MGCPILGDPHYGTPESDALSQSLGIPAQLLCARQLNFSHPITAANITIRSQMTPKLP